MKKNKDAAGLCVFLLLIFLSFDHIAKAAAPAQYHQFYKITVTEGSLRNISHTLDSVFIQNNFINAVSDEATSSIKLECIKGTSIEQVKAVLVLFNLAIVSYKEEYSIQSPLIFN